MHSAPDLSWPHLAKFIRHHTHDVRNSLNSLDLEASMIAELIPDGEAGESARRIRAQIRRLAADLRALAARFAEPRPSRSHCAAHELLLIWQDQLAALDPAPAVQWGDTPSGAEVNVDATALANVFRELLVNAHAFGNGAPLLATVRIEDGQVAFELHEPKDAPIETASWGRAPFASLRQGHYGLGLWEAQRTIAASGGEVQRRFSLDAMELITTLSFPAA